MVGNAARSRKRNLEVLAVPRGSSGVAALGGTDDPWLTARCRLWACPSAAISTYNRSFRG